MNPGERRRGPGFVVALLLGWPGLAAAQFLPAQYTAGSVPAIPIAAVSGGEVFLDILVDATGRVANVTVLRTTPPFTAELVGAVRTWRFLPAEDDVPGAADPADARRRIPVDSHVFVAAVYRPPTLVGPTLGETPKDVETPTDAVPAPVTTLAPALPAGAFADGVVLLEGRLGATGMVEAAGVLRSAPPFDQVALEALRGWTFRPPRVAGRVVPARVYVVFAFRQPVTGKSSDLRISPRAGVPPRRALDTSARQPVATEEPLAAPKRPLREEGTRFGGHRHVLLDFCAASLSRPACDTLTGLRVAR